MQESQGKVFLLPKSPVGAEHRGCDGIFSSFFLVLPSGISPAVAEAAVPSVIIFHFPSVHSLVEF